MMVDLRVGWTALTKVETTAVMKAERMVGSKAVTKVEMTAAMKAETKVD